MNKNNEFGKHPSEEIQKIFSQRPFQIQKPEKAKIIFLGLDANIDENIEHDKPFFDETLEYLRDGVKYWKSHEYHTPMLNLNYRGNGVRYHKQFCKLGITSNYAEDICFLELLNFCTYGKSSGNPQFKEFLNGKSNQEHLERIRNLSNMNKIICVSVGVRNYIDELRLFNTKNENIIVHTNFANAISNEELKNLGSRLRKHLDN